MSKVIILGAKGRFGRAASTAFVKAGWEVTALARQFDEPPVAPIETAICDAMDGAALTKACVGFDLIVNTLNPPYENWARDLPVLTRNVIAAAQASGATVLIPGNVYNYGADKPELMTETTPWQPTTRKGKLRVKMEEAFRASGVRTIVLRGGDFFEREKSGSWFDAYIAVNAQQGRTMYPGPLDRVHAWAYLPDMARAAVMLAGQRDQFDGFEQFGFEGYSLTGAELVAQIEQATGRAQKVSGMPWFLLPLVGLFKPTIREVYEMRYLWSVPHRMDGRKLARAIPVFRPTPIREAMQEMMSSS